MRPEAFEITIADHELRDLRARLERTRWADDFGNEDWSRGVDRGYLEALIGHWLNAYDWRQHEAAMNAFPQFRIVLDDVPIHLIHQKGRGEQPLPLILSHGWPWTFWDMHKIIRPLADPASFGGDPGDAFDVVVPSLPGFGFSNPLRRSGVGALATADLWRKLMVEVLGYEHFGAHGGDWGAFVTAQLGHKYGRDLVGIHLLGGAPLDCFNEPLPGASEYAADEAGWYERTQRFFAERHAYLLLQASRPQTLAYALTDSPIGLCAWLLDKRREWSDCNGEVEQRFTKDELLTSVMIYWLTGTIGTSARYYYESRTNPWTPSHPGSPAVGVPTGCLKLEHDVCHWPRSAMGSKFNLRRWTRSAQGGHFAPMEEPELVVTEIREFFRPLRNR